MKNTIVYEIDMLCVKAYKHRMNPESLYKRIGAFIAARRNGLGWKQEELAKRVGVSRASLANIERGRQSVLVHHLYALAKALGLPPAQLLPAPDEVAADEPLPLPSDLKPAEIKDITRLLAGPAESIQTPSKDDRRVKRKKR